jgi:serine/threonine protein kinase|eukprot:SAG25_NODE_576_length_6788_cov_7.020033_8_plen_137_part_00
MAAAWTTGPSALCALRCSQDFRRFTRLTVARSRRGQSILVLLVAVHCHRQLTYMLRRLQRILKEKPRFPSGFPKEAKSFVLALLEQDPSKRLGCLANGVQDILTHSWFSSTDWQKMADRYVSRSCGPSFLGTEWLF